MNAQADAGRYEIRKYPNRRFYDVTRSRHVTLDDLYVLVKEGHEIVVTDSRTGADITNVVLTQIILEHDPPKLDLFPAALLHQAIQANQQMVRRFVDEYFAQAVNAFAESRKGFDEFLRRSGFSALQPMAPFDWVRMLFPGLGSAGSQPPATAGSGPSAGDRTHESGSATAGAARASASTHARPSQREADDARALRAELDELRAELAGLRRSAPARKPKRRVK